MIGNWILDIASSADENLNQNLLSKLLHSLTVYWRNDRLNNLNQLYTKDSSSEFIPITTNSSSIFIKNTCLKLGKADKLIQQKYEKILPDDSLKFGQKFFIDPPNIVILKASGMPNYDKGIFESCDIYSDNIKLTNSKYFDEKYLDIASDEAIFHKNIKRILIHLHEKLSCFISLNLLWTSVGIALHLFAAKQQVIVDFLLDGCKNNDVPQLKEYYDMLPSVNIYIKIII
ncbi:hypothetical protein C2G38_2160693 [Gigaspora rosea]|uniref:Uncharacterized protein n=1 Tax=Gigaspora rosea TaxID=44941 RepID=A0A397VXZ6_9GLOM|nr:hypothetical protein C2G38_2160693 [Gigaspora rosea]